MGKSKEHRDGAGDIGRRDETGGLVGPGDARASYRSVEREAEAELVIKKSRFIGCVAPVGNVDEARDFIDRISSRHAQATHNVWAYRVGLSGEQVRCDDDGEPSGTAGRPALEVLERRGLTRVAVVVTRYFGGILLGASGLVRAYAQAAAGAVDAGRPVVWRLHARLRTTVSYALSGRIPPLVNELGGSVDETTYTDNVTYVLGVEGAGMELLMAALRDATSGDAEIVPLSPQFRPVTASSDANS